MSLNLGSIAANLGPVLSIFGQIAAIAQIDYAEFINGQQVSLPPITTYVAGKHVQIGPIPVSLLGTATPAAQPSTATQSAARSTLTPQASATKAE